MSHFNSFQVGKSETPNVNKQNCVLCGRVSGGSVCKDCADEARKYKEIINNFLAGNPGSTLLDVCSGTNISLKLIKAFMDMGWISLIPNNDEDGRRKPMF